LLTGVSRLVNVFGAANVAIMFAEVRDAHEAALLADAKRLEYERHSPVFWRPAEKALERHEPWLAKCPADEGYTSFAARRGERLAGIAMAAHSVSATVSVRSRAVVAGR
jgi:hypothetical protein